MLHDAIEPWKFLDTKLLYKYTFCIQAICEDQKSNNILMDDRLTN